MRATLLAIVVFCLLVAAHGFGLSYLERGARILDPIFNYHFNCLYTAVELPRWTFPEPQSVLLATLGSPADSLKLVVRSALPLALYTLLSVVIYHKLRFRVWRKTADPRCRTCGYCLAGLQEPRCPECGEHV